MAAAPTARGGADNISSTGTGGPHAHLPGSSARTARGSDERPTPPLPGAQRARPLALLLVLSFMFFASAPARARACAPACAPAREHAAPRAARTARKRLAPPPNKNRRRTPGATHEQRRATTKRCCVPTWAQSRRRRSMGQAKTGRSPRQRGPVARAGARPLPPMRAWLEQPHGRRHKAPPQPCALTTKSAGSSTPPLVIFPSQGVTPLPRPW